MNSKLAILKVSKNNKYKLIDIKVNNFNIYLSEKERLTDSYITFNCMERFCWPDYIWTLSG